MHGVKLVGLDLDAPSGNARLIEIDSKPRLASSVFSACWLMRGIGQPCVAPNFRRASCRRRTPALNGEPTRSRYERGEAPCVFLPAEARGYASRGSAAPRHGRSPPLPWGRQAS